MTARLFAVTKTQKSLRRRSRIASPSATRALLTIRSISYGNSPKETASAVSAGSLPSRSRVRNVIGASAVPAIVRRAPDFLPATASIEEIEGNSSAHVEAAAFRSRSYVDPRPNSFPVNKMLNASMSLGSDLKFEPRRPVVAAVDVAAEYVRISAPRNL